MGFFIWPERIYDPITVMGFLAMLIFQLDNTNSSTLPAPIAVMGVIDTFRLDVVAIGKMFYHI